MAGPVKTQPTTTASAPHITIDYDYNEPVGNVFYVSSTSSTSVVGGPGYSPEKAFTTLAAALAACTANNGDEVRIMPCHTETIVGAAGITMSKAGVRVVGMGVGRNRPRFNWTTAIGASWDISAADCALENCVFDLTGFDAITAGFNISGSDFTFKDNEIEVADSGGQAVLGILTTAAADRLRIENNHFHGSLDAGTTAVIKLVGGDSIVLIGNTIYGAHSTSGSIFNETTACTGLMILGNTIHNNTADGNNKVINVHASTTGMIARNSLAIIDSTGPAPVTAAAMNVAGNYYSSAPGVGAASTLL